MNTIGDLEGTYVVERDDSNPSSPFTVRVVAPDAQGLDRLPSGETNDVLGHGPTLNEAVTNVIEKKRILNKRILKRFLGA